MLRRVVWLVVVWASWEVSKGAICPWRNPGLLDWHAASTWDDGVPTDGAQVVIKSGKRVLLSAQPASLSTLTIEAGGALVWDDVDNITLNTHYIVIKGELHIGAEGCRFNKTARIRLHGKLKDNYHYPEHEFGRKFIGVAPGGVLELHGMEKTSWTKLAQTIQPVYDLDCAVIYSHEKSVLASDRQKGLHIISWTPDGAVLDYNVIKSYQGFDTYFNTLPDGAVIAMFAYGDQGLGMRKKSQMNILEAEPVIRSLGGAVVVWVDKGDSYSFIGKKGNTTSVKEFTKKLGQDNPAPKGYLHLHDPDTKLVFQVSTSSAEKDYFRVLHEDAAYPIITLADDITGWNVGDQIFVASTDFNWTQAEKRKIIDCDGKCNSRQFRMNDNFAFLHYGNFTRKVDERAEVGMLTRSIQIEGVMEDSCYYENDPNYRKVCKTFGRDVFGGHVMFVKGHKAVHVQGVELFHVGQQTSMGHYPLHFHMCGNVKGMYLRENTVHHSFSRCFTVHGTHHLEVSNNVCYKHLGHGLFIEDAVEQYNNISSNLIVGTMHGTLLLSDMSKDFCKLYEESSVENCGDLSSYWITHPNNNITGNVAAGGEGNGFMYVFADAPLGPSRALYEAEGLVHHPKDQALYFTNNVAHSCGKNGVFADSKVSTGTGMENKGKVQENGIIQTESEYFPHIDGKPVWCNMSYGTYYKNSQGNMWIKGGNIIVSHSTMADSPEGFSGGTTLFDTGTQVYKCIFVGETENKGCPGKRSIPPDISPTGKTAFKYFQRSFGRLPTTSLTGVGLYQGPVFVKHSFFDQYTTKSWCLDDLPADKCSPSHLLTEHAGAISFKRSNTYPTMTSTYVENNTFGYCDDVKSPYVFQGKAPEVQDFQWKDGNTMIYFRDKDGRLTGTVNASVVPDTPLYKGPQCLEVPYWGNLAVCPYRYIKFELLGNSGSLSGKASKEYPLIIRRDDEPYRDPFTMAGEIRNEFLLQTHKSYVVDFNMEVKSGGFPKELKLFGYGVESQDTVRIGICQPKDVTSYDISMDYPAVLRDNATWVTSLAALDNDTTGRAFFHDKKNGMVFFKIISFHDDTNETQQCPDGNCWKIKLTRNGGSSTLRSCKNVNVPPYVPTKTIKTPTKPKLPDCATATPEGLGSVDWDAVTNIVTTNYTVPCLTPPSPGRRQQRKREGCYVEKKTTIHSDIVELYNSMTVDLCLDRCYYRKYKYAAVSRTRRCLCGHTLVRDEKVPDDKCNQACVGNKNMTCGGKVYQEVYDTGFTTPSVTV